MHELFSRYIKDSQKPRNFISILILSRTIIYFVTKHIAFPPTLSNQYIKVSDFLNLSTEIISFTTCAMYGWFIQVIWMYDYSFIYCIYDSNSNIYFFNLQMSLLQCICFMAVFSTLGRRIFFYLKIKLFLFNMIMCIIPQVQRIQIQLLKKMLSF